MEGVVKISPRPASHRARVSEGEVVLVVSKASPCLRSVCIIQSDIINFQHVLTSFAVFQSFTDLFRDLNDGEIENHYKMNSENVGTWHGIIISPA